MNSLSHEEWKAKNQPLPNWTKFLWDYNLLRNPHPVYYEVDLTNKCQLNCFGGKCCSYEERQKPIKYMETPIFLDILTSARVHRCGMVLTGGGEPTLHPAFEYIVDKCTEALHKGMENWLNPGLLGLGLVTNGVEVANVNYFMTHINPDDNAWVRISLNDRKPSDGLVELFHTYPKRIGLSLIYDAQNEASFGQAARNRKLLEPVAKFIRMIPFHDLSIPSKIMTPKECYGRKFLKIFGPNGVEQYCCLARGKDGEPPKFCPQNCRWEEVNPEDAWKCNPYT